MSNREVFLNRYAQVAEDLEINNPRDFVEARLDEVIRNGGMPPGSGKIGYGLYETAKQLGLTPTFEAISVFLDEEVAK